jgi:formylglycine-generating enzyme required for sulfatase activity
MTNADPPTRLREILSQTVFIRGANVPFGELTAADARARADELRAATGWGPTARVAPVALAWAELARTLEQTAVPAVGDLDEELLVKLAPRLWIVPPGGSIL